jgi:AcrR family transcriptional regulator
MASKTKVQNHTRRGSVVDERTGRRARRAEIIETILQSLRSNGVVVNSLNDLARAAEISVSHLLYYFPNKEALQFHLVTAINEQMMEEMDAYRFASPDKRIELLADYYFAGRAIPSAYGAMVFEQMGLTMHNAHYRNHMNKMADSIQAYLQGLFRDAPMARGMGVADAAVIAGALWMGLFVTSHYYRPLTRARAHQIFRRILLQLAGLNNTKARKAVSHSRGKTLNRVALFG